MQLGEVAVAEFIRFTRDRHDVGRPSGHIVERHFRIRIIEVGGDEGAADMTQEVFCRIFERLEHYRHQKSFFAWLYTLALNYAKDWSRKQSNRERKFDRFSKEYTNNEARSPASIFEAGQETRGLINALGLLPVDRREMVLLRYRHERSIREIAEIFDISESAVKMRLHRALEELGHNLKN